MNFNTNFILASGNPHKVDELRQIFKPLGIELKSALDFPDTDEVVEDQPDLEGNAFKKARYWHRKTGLPALADDTGLEVEALNGAPGVYSARYAGGDATYDDNITKLLEELDGKQNRAAQFRTVVAFVDGEVEELFEGACPGKIINQKRGDKGFGYDPVFVPEGFTETFAELSSEQKNKISHRGIAVEKFISYLKSVL
ncbi:MAG: RdgB/HAM1 family non-canonical purine NTP pyrophosphatase [Balneolaceae bacterium]